MKVTVNLAHPKARFERSVYFWGLALVVLGLALLVRILMVTGREVIEYRKVSRSVLSYQGEIGDLRNRESRLRASLRRPATQQLYDQISFLNSLIAQKQVSLSGLTLKLSGLLPSQTRLTSLALVESQGGPRVELSVEGEGNDSVYSFLSRLENSPDFDSVAVTNQAFEPQGPDKGDVTLSCSARYVGGRLP
ncbi:MAG TPA: PilN domain-containing protein [Terriglobia bacterium]|nr:PilN domain-containing protein [Terriglobia bacterium]